MPKKKRAMTFWHAALYTWDYKDNEFVAIDDNFRVTSFSWGGGANNLIIMNQNCNVL